jgi:hypothetical protein
MLNRTYKSSLQNVRALEEGRLQVRSRAFRYIRKGRRGRNAVFKVLISRCFGMQNKKAIGAIPSTVWLRLLFTIARKFASILGAKWFSRNEYRFLPARTMQNTERVTLREWKMALEAGCKNLRIGVFSTRSWVFGEV